MQTNKAPTKKFLKYLDYASIILFNFAIKLQEYNIINDYTIKLIENKQFLYILIYSLIQIKLEILKTFIKTYLTIAFI